MMASALLEKHAETKVTMHNETLATPDLETRAEIVKASANGLDGVAGQLKQLGELQHAANSVDTSVARGAFDPLHIDHIAQQTEAEWAQLDHDALVAAYNNNVRARLRGTGPGMTSD